MSTRNTASASSSPWKGFSKLIMKRTLPRQKACTRDTRRSGPATAVRYLAVRPSLTLSPTISHTVFDPTARPPARPSVRPPLQNFKIAVATHIHTQTYQWSQKWALLQSQTVYIYLARSVFSFRQFPFRKKYSYSFHILCSQSPDKWKCNIWVKLILLVSQAGRFGLLWFINLFFKL